MSENSRIKRINTLYTSQIKYKREQLNTINLMYYKLTNPQGETFRKLKELRTKEMDINRQNRLAIMKAAGHSFVEYIGSADQQTLNRTIIYEAFKFMKPQDLDPQVWQEDKEYKGFYKPYGRTKTGRAMDDFIDNLPKSDFRMVLTALNLRHPHGISFKLPYLALMNKDLLLLELDDYFRPTVTGLTEITREEFYQHNLPY